MTRASLLALLLLCAAPQARGQAAPPKTPAAEAVAEAFAKLRAAKLTSRVTRTRHYAMRLGESVFRLEVRGREVGATLELSMQLHHGARPDRFFEFEYRIDAQGKLETFRVTQVRLFRGGQRTRAGFLAKVGGERLSIHALEGGRVDPQAEQIPWSNRALPTTFLWFFVPSLFDQGLPRVLEPDVITEEKIRPGRKPEPARFVCPSESVKRADGLSVRAFKLSGRKNREDAAVTVITAGPRAGEVLQVKIDSKRRFDRISAKEYARMAAEATRAAQERRAIAFLRGLHYTQGAHRKNKGTFAATFAELKALDRHFAGRLAQVEQLYAVALRASPDRSKWMAIATPKQDKNKSGERPFVINQDGKVHTGADLALDDACAIPAGATPVK